MNDKELQEVGKQVIKKRGRGGEKNSSIVRNNTATTDEISQIVHESFQYFKRPIVKTDEECAQRLNDYFEQCVTTGQIPTVEDMCLALGTTRKTVFLWQNGQGCSTVRQNMIKQAKEILAGIDAKLVAQGKIPQITYIFRAKNYFDLSDKQEVVVTPNDPFGDTKSREELEAQYVDSVVDVDD